MFQLNFRVCVCLSSGGLFIFFVRVSSFFSYFLCYPHFGTLFSTWSLSRFCVKCVLLEISSPFVKCKSLVLSVSHICCLPYWTFICSCFRIDKILVIKKRNLVVYRCILQRYTLQLFWLSMRHRLVEQTREWLQVG